MSFNPESKRYVDGGAVSNLPAWVFSDEKLYLERELQDRVPIFAFELGSYTPENHGDMGSNPLCIRLFNKIFKEKRIRSSKFRRYTEQLLRAAVFGNQRITDDLLVDLYTVPVQTNLSVFDLDLTVETAGSSVSEGYETAKKYFALSKQRRILFDEFQITLKAELERLCFKGETLRACIIEAIEEGRYSFKVTASIGMDDDADDALVIDSRNKGAPTAFKEGKSVFAYIFQDNRENLKMTKYEFSLVRPQLCSMICVPVFPLDKEHKTVDTDRRPRAVIAVDSDADLSAQYKNDDFMGWLESSSLVASKIIFGSEEVSDGG